MKTIHFISGLPRTGSTLLSSVLNQNPRFLAPPTSILATSLVTMHHQFRNLEHYKNHPTQLRLDRSLKAFCGVFYAWEEEEVIFDKSRAWTGFVNLAAAAFDNTNPKVIACVRSVDEILASFLHLTHKNPTNNFIDKILIDMKVDVDDHNRCVLLLGEKNPTLGLPLTHLAQGLEDAPGQIHLVEYWDLVKSPHKTLEGIYDFIGEEPFEHDFSSIEQVEDNAAEAFGMPDVHTVRPSISPSSTDVSILPEAIRKEVETMNFWRKVH